MTSALAYLSKQLQSWSSIGTQDSGLFATYRSSADRCDVYDNALVVNALVMLWPASRTDPPQQAVRILNFALGAVNYIREHETPELQLVAAAYRMNLQTGQPDLCSDSSCAVQDVGNNACLCIAIAKFLWRFPRTDYLDMLKFLMKNIAALLRDCGELRGYGGRVVPQPRYISTEHMIDLFGLCRVSDGLFRDDAEAEARRKGMETVARNFVIQMFYTTDDVSAYRIGTTPECAVNVRDAQPVDTITWNVLAAADPNAARLRAGMQTVIDKFVVSAVDKSTGAGAGVRFTSASDCAQYENTGAYLCAMTVFNAANKPALVPPEAQQDMYKFIRMRMQQGEAIPGAWSKPCATGLGWDYYPDGHLAATVYCCLASLEDPRANIYALGFRQDEEEEEGKPCSVSTWPWILSVCVLAFLFLLFFALFLACRRRT